MYYGDKVAYEPTLAECLDSLFGKGAGTPLTTAYPIEEGRLMAEAIEKGEVDPSKPPQTEPGGESADPGENADPDYLELANEAYEKALEYLQQMKEYLDLAGGASEDLQTEEQDLTIEEDN